MTCEFNSQKDFTELLEKLNAYHPGYSDDIKIANIIQQINPNKPDLTEEEKCLLTLLTGYVSWLQGDADRTLGHLKELAANSSPSDKLLQDQLCDYVFSSPSMTSEFLLDGCKKLFHEHFPKHDWNYFVQGIKKETQDDFEVDVYIHTFDEFLDKFNIDASKQDTSQLISLYEGYMDFRCKEKIKIVYTIRALLNLSNYLELYEKDMKKFEDMQMEQKESGGRKSKRKINNKKSRKRKRGGVKLIKFMPFFVWLCKYFKVFLGIATAAGVFTGSVSHLVPDEMMPTASKLSGSALILGLLTLLYAKNQEYFNIQRPNIKNLPKFEMQTIDGKLELVKIPDSPGLIGWLRGNVQEPRNLSIQEIDNVLRRFTGFIVDLQLIGDQLQSKFIDAYTVKLQKYYYTKVQDVIKIAVSKLETFQEVEKRKAHRSEEYTGLNGQQIMENARIAGLLTEAEKAELISNVTQQFMDIIQESVTTQLNSELGKAEKGQRVYDRQTESLSAEINNQYTPLSSVIGFLLAGAITHELNVSNLPNAFPQKINRIVYNICMNILMGGIGIFVGYKLNLPGAAKLIPLAYALYYLKQLMISMLDDETLLLYKYTSPTLSNQTTVDEQLVEHAEYIKNIQNTYKLEKSKYAPKEYDKMSYAERLQAAALPANPNEFILDAKYVFNNSKNNIFTGWLMMNKMASFCGTWTLDIGTVGLISVAAVTMFNSYTTTENKVKQSATALIDALEPFTFDFNTVLQKLDDAGLPPSIGNKLKMVDQLCAAQIDNINAAAVLNDKLRQDLQFSLQEKALQLQEQAGVRDQARIDIEGKSLELQAQAAQTDQERLKIEGQSYQLQVDALKVKGQEIGLIEKTAKEIAGIQASGLDLQRESVGLQKQLADTTPSMGRRALQKKSVGAQLAETSEDVQNKALPGNLTLDELRKRQRSLWATDEELITHAFDSVEGSIPSDKETDMVKRVRNLDKAATFAMVKESYDEQLVDIISGMGTPEPQRVALGGNKYKTKKRAN